MKSSTVFGLLALCWAGSAWTHEPLAAPLTADHSSAEARPTAAPEREEVRLREWIKHTSKQPDAAAAPYRLSEPQRQHLREQLRVPVGQSDTLR